MSRLSRNKGKRGEREVVAFLRRWFAEARRGYQYRDGAECCDVEGTPFWVEVKLSKTRPNVHRAMEQALAAGEHDARIPIVVSRQDRGEWLVTCQASELQTMAELLMDGK